MYIDMTIDIRDHSIFIKKIEYFHSKIYAAN